MNKLRELIDANKYYALGYHKEPLDRWVSEHLDDMADLIDAARAYLDSDEDERDDISAVVFDAAVARNNLRDAIAKVNDK
jgi:hypothetical protein